MSKKNLEFLFARFDKDWNGVLALREFGKLV